MQKRHGSSQAEIPVQLPLQEGHEEGEELPAHLLEHVPELAGYVAKRTTPSAGCGFAAAPEPESEPEPEPEQGSVPAALAVSLCPRSSGSVPAAAAPGTAGAPLLRWKSTARGCSRAPS